MPRHAGRAFAPPLGSVARGVRRRTPQMNGHPRRHGSPRGGTEPGLQTVWPFTTVRRPHIWLAAIWQLLLMYHALSSITSHGWLNQQVFPEHSENIIRLPSSMRARATGKRAVSGNRKPRQRQRISDE